MVDMVLLQTVSVVVASIGLLVAAIYYVLQIRHQNMIRQTDLVMRLYATFAGTEFQNAWYKVRTSNDLNVSDIFEYPQELFMAINQVCLFFEGVGILLQRGLVDIRMVEDLFGGTLGRAWEQMRTGITQARQQLSDKTVYYYFEYLYNKMKKREPKLQEDVNNG